MLFFGEENVYGLDVVVNIIIIIVVAFFLGYLRTRP